MHPGIGASGIPQAIYERVTLVFILLRRTFPSIIITNANSTASTTMLGPDWSFTSTAMMKERTLTFAPTMLLPSESFVLARAMM
jgi:hypothetical protein